MATLTSPAGKVLVNSGKGFVAADDGMALPKGARVMLGDKASATLTFSETGCTLPLAEKSLTTVSGPGMCALVSPAAVFSPANGLRVIPASSQAVNGEIPPALIASGIVAASIAALLLTDNGNGKPVSAP